MLGLFACRNIGAMLSVQGGVVVEYSEDSVWPHHVTPDVYEGFVEHLRERQEDSKKRLQEMYDKWGTPEAERTEAARPLVIPKPMYWCDVTERYEVEPWYVLTA